MTLQTEITKDRDTVDRRTVSPAISPRIRPARWGDKDALLQMIHALAHHHGDEPELTMAALIDLMGAGLPWLRLLVAEDSSGESEGLLGYAGLVGGVQLQHGRKNMDLHHLFIRQDMRGRGVGRALIDAARQEAVALDCHRLTVSTQTHNTRAQETYLACGFEPRDITGAHFAMQLR
ncbi:GNAT family N-acetyltransferase [Celeribacter neptunius]|uniref:L-amino acid N-acyltransferase YncA n=1 Tax=Celeribacter neptunius TaxID=588602 RepID=A0A1I3KLK0_9RHOB|nr:GNAT family N-acetyltransferase [Celeribacter neptunius]SFI73391.1 L-amino acid N-acyltransferase YncA [Celeribacter neptunius]